MMTQTRESPKLRFRADDGSEFPKWKSMPMRSLFSEVIEKNHPEYPVLSIRQGCGTILRDSSDRNIEYDKSNLTNYKVIEKGDFIIHLRSFEGGLECSALQGISSPAYRILRSDCIIPEAYKDYFRSHEFINHRLSEAVVGIRDGKNIDMNIFWEIKVPYMALPEQQKIADFLSAYDKKISLQKERVETLKEQKKGLLQKMFPKEGESVPELRFPGFTGDWEQRKLGDISEIKTGPFGSTLHADDYVSDGVPIITTEHFKRGSLPTDKCGLPQVSENDFNRLSAYILNEGDIVFSRVGSVDINALITPFQRDWLFSGRVLRVRPQGKNSSQFLHTLLETENVKSDIRTRAVGQTMPSINTEILKITPLLLPASIAEQELLGKYFWNLDRLITLHQRKLETMQEIKKGLLQQMFC